MFTFYASVTGEYVTFAGKCNAFIFLVWQFGSVDFEERDT